MEENKPVINNRFSFGQRLTMLFGCFVLGLIVTLILVALVSNIGLDGKKSIVISAALQNVFAFVLPAAAVVVFTALKPLEFLRINRAPSMKGLLALVSIYVVMMPAFNWLTNWNEHLSLPEYMAPIENMLRNAENAAAVITNVIFTNNSIFELIVSVLVVGVLTGFSEEFFFRGALQRIFSTRPTNVHASIWITAFVFSAIHMQFFGFFPRLVLGAIFGYLLWWSGSLWLPIIAHTLNNSIAIISHYASEPGAPKSTIETIGIHDPWIAILSAIATVVLFVAFTRYFKKIDK